MHARPRSTCTCSRGWSPTPGGDPALCARVLEGCADLMAADAEPLDLTGHIADVPGWIEASIAVGDPVVVLATGDPLCFGIGSLLARRIDRVWDLGGEPDPGPRYSRPARLALGADPNPGRAQPPDPEPASPAGRKSGLAGTGARAEPTAGRPNPFGDRPMPGTLITASLGPGDPGLVTRVAWSALERARCWDQRRGLGVGPS